MIGFIDNFHEDDEFLINIGDNDFAKRLISIRLLLSFFMVLIITVFIVIIYIPIVILSIINNILDLGKYIYNKIRNQPRFQKNRIKNTLNKYYSQLDKEELLYLGDKDLVFEEDNVKDFILKFLDSYNNIYYTYKKSTFSIVDDDENISYKIYRNSMYGKDPYRGTGIFCTKSRRRSLGDIYRICKTYFPDTKIEEVLEILISLCASQKIGGCYCSTIEKFVFHKKNINFYPNSDTEYGDIKFQDVIWYIANK